MKKAIATIFVLATLAIAVPADAFDVTQFNHDYYSSGGYDYGDSIGGKVFEIWEIGGGISDGKLYFSIWQNMPETGAVQSDAYAENPLLSPGDLWITTGTYNPFEPGATRYAIALTSHANVVQQKYPNEIWPDVTKGNLYANPQWATGTYETYQKYMNDNGYWYTPNDQDGNDEINSYMTLIKDFDGEVTGQSDVTWTEEPYWDWSTSLNDWVQVDAWRITGSVNLSAIGMTPNMPYNIFISSECGNDGAVYANVPEPATAGLFAMSALGLLARKRRRI